MLIEWFNPNIENMEEITPEQGTDARRRLFWGLLMALTIPALFAFGIYDFFIQRATDESFFDISIAAIFTANLMALRKVKNGKPLYRLNALVGVVLMFYYAYTGSADGSSIFWMFTLPPAVIYLLGRKEGFIWIGLLYVLTILSFIIPDLPHTYPYTIATKIRFGLSFLMVTTLSYGFESLHMYFNDRLVRTNKRLQDSLDRVRTLEKLLPICARCKKIRNEKNEWKNVETYISTKLDTQFTHGICPECSKELYPEMHDRTNAE